MQVMVLLLLLLGISCREGILGSWSQRDGDIAGTRIARGLRLQLRLLARRRGGRSRGRLLARTAAATRLGLLLFVLLLGLVAAVGAGVFFVISVVILLPTRPSRCRGCGCGCGSCGGCSRSRVFSLGGRAVGISVRLACIFSIVSSVVFCGPPGLGRIIRHGSGRLDSIFSGGRMSRKR